MIDFGLQPSLEPVAVEDAAQISNPPQPLGWDIGFSAVVGDLLASSDGDLVLIDELPALQQWIAVTLDTQQGQELVYSRSYGSQLTAIIAAGYPIGGYVQEQVDGAIRDAMALHNRIDRVDNLIIFPVMVTGEPLYFRATVVLDTDERLALEGATSV